MSTLSLARDGYGGVKGGRMMKFGVGLTVSKFNFGLGLATQSIKWMSEADTTNFKGGNNALYIESGVCF